MRIDDLQGYLKGKTVAIIGNSQSVLKAEHPEIDGFDIVIRMNKGFPQGKEKHIGSRTDILAVAVPVGMMTIKEKFNPKYIVWINVNGANPAPGKAENLFIYPQKFWDDLYHALGDYPSTGCMVTDLILSRCNHNAKDVSLYGFDFWKTETWYHIEQDYYPRHPHNPEKEEIYIRDLLNRKNL